jgi:hypothetical protein
VGIRKRDYYIHNKHWLAETAKLYNQTHKRAGYKHAWYLWKKGKGPKPKVQKKKAKPKISVLERRAMYRQANQLEKKRHPEQVLSRGRRACRKYYWKHRKRILQQYRCRSEEQRTAKRKYARDYMRKKRRTDICFRIAHCVRKRIGDTLKHFIRTGRAVKAAKSETLLGCTYADYVRYLESKFQPGMTWDNYGFGEDKWNIDHILACASFDLAKPIEQHKCFHYSNTQPMWQSENLAKGNR